MSYIIWDRDKCVIFKSKQELKARDYVHDNKSMSEWWDGWVNSATAPNHVAVINQYDTKMPYEDAPDYLKPVEQL
jgi:hypothetical protein